jgi:hypothetical protein
MGYKRERGLSKFCLSVARANEVKVRHTKPEIYQDFAKTFDVGPRVLYNTLCKLRYKVLCHRIDIKTLWDCFGTRTLRIPGGYLKTFPLIEQCMKDGQRNIAPLVARTGKSPQQLREWMGKGNWKKLCGRSLSYNREFSHCLQALTGAYSTQQFGIGDHKKVVSLFLDLPYSTCRLRTTFNPLLAQKGINLGKLLRENRIASKKPEIYDAWDTIVDTLRMLRTLNRDYNPDWSLSRWKEEHDKASKEITAMEDLADNVNFREEQLAIPESGYHVLPLEFEAGSYGKATLLTSRKALREEGSKMKHCVASYADFCKQGKYAVYSITDSDSNSSTLGLYLWLHPMPVWTVRVLVDGTILEKSNAPGDTPRLPTWEVQQHQGYNNKTPITSHQSNVVYQLLTHIGSKEKERNDKSS